MSGRMHLKKIFLTVLALSFISTKLIIAQEQQGEDYYIQELQKIGKDPISPEAAAFQTYGNTPVNYITGTPNVTIPLYEFKGLEASLPVNLNYDASGVKVEELSSWVGLKWNLNLGGRIVRIVNGLPDDYISGGSYNSIYNPNVSEDIIEYKSLNQKFESVLQAQQYLNFLYDISMNFIDSQPDYYQISLPGISEKFVIDISSPNKEAHVIGNPRIKIERYSNSLESSTNGW
ncbi:hypothetical protein JM83_2922 [Gillisia sp. Hel_I_86]|uniref:hypothetical protein n=1 Tax=Gillisia sp. Hel_I_86 TaxID=1249981 RepID=UPI0011997CDC|nr:hypothetical protein [Gillisia sp. Hel_I_86]TVZ27854.1 hypothetical protein JM83_2922 [Gillisia sp. Hel_I_86]